MFFRISPGRPGTFIQTLLPWEKFQVSNLYFYSRFSKLQENPYLWMQICILFGFDKNVRFAKSSGTFRKLDGKKKKKKLFIHFCSSICNFHYFLVDVCIFQFLGIALLCLIHSLLWFPETGTYELALNVLSD